MVMLKSRMDVREEQDGAVVGVLPFRPSFQPIGYIKCTFPAAVDAIKCAWLDILYLFHFHVVIHPYLIRVPP